MTNRLEICLGFDDFGAMYLRNGLGCVISKEEALEHLDACEKKGLIIQPTNEKKPEAICLCCGCCCGLIEIMNSLPRPADFVASNFYAALDAASCNGCGKCLRRCQMNAFTLKDKKAILNTGRCIGCGLCVTTCKTGSLTMIKKETETIPPRESRGKIRNHHGRKKGTRGQTLEGG